VDSTHAGIGLGVVDEVAPLDLHHTNEWQVMLGVTPGIPPCR